jgi:hypothetical protein
VVQTVDVDFDSSEIINNPVRAYQKGLNKKILRILIMIIKKTGTGIPWPLVSGPV